MSRSSVCWNASIYFTGAQFSSLGITNQRETAFVWSRKTGKPLCNAIVWDDSRTKNLVAHYEHILHNKGLEISPGVWKKGQEAIDALREMSVYVIGVHPCTDLPLKLRSSIIDVLFGYQSPLDD